MPFFFHWYVGVVPPLVGVAVNVTLVPVQIVVDGVEIETVGVSFGLTVIVIAVDVAFGVLAQAELLTIFTVTWSPLVNVVLVNVVAVVLAAPWETAPINHS